ncbi:hypothetical protein EBR04_06955 [bacterium]|nr:hypothetical protein [bacterium]
MPTDTQTDAIPSDRLSIEKRKDGTLVVRVQSEERRLPDAVFSFRCGDPQYAYWLARHGQLTAD